MEIIRGQFDYSNSSHTHSLLRMSMINLFSGHALRCPHAQNVMSWNMGQGQNKMVEALIASTWKLHVLQVLLNDVLRVVPSKSLSY